ncbi:MAG: peptidylprolyl isomerase [Treponema sp.]|nr:peptidylprolyl isomerase [Treponema sp.]
MRIASFKPLPAAVFVLLASTFLSCQQVPNLPDGLYARLDTAKGQVMIKLEYEKAPLTVGNFVGLAEGSLTATKGKHFYDGLIFHRVEPGFVVQGGDPQGDGTGGPGYSFPDEISPDLVYDAPGIVGMANAGPGTNGSQFFITLKAAPFLNGHYSIFGKVVSGMDVVQKIVKGDKLAKVEIFRIGAGAKAFKSDQAAFDQRLAAALDTAKKLAETQRSDALATIAKQWPDLKPDQDGIFQKVLKRGTGEPPAKGDKVSVDYKGTFLDGTVFDQSSLHGGPFQFTVGTGQIIPGWDKVVSTMKKGEKRLVILPPELAYGAQGAGGVIPPNAFLVFEIQVVDIQK